MRDKAFMFI